MANQSSVYTSDIKFIYNTATGHRHPVRASSEVSMALGVGGPERPGLKQGGLQPSHPCSGVWDRDLIRHVHRRSQAHVPEIEAYVRSIKNFVAWQRAYSPATDVLTNATPEVGVPRVAGIEMDGNDGSTKIFFHFT